MARSMNLGMPRIGPRRELKRAVEGYWAGTTDADPPHRRGPDPAGRQLARAGRGGHREHPLQRLLPLRPGSRHHLPGRGRPAPLRPPGRPRRPRHLLRPGPGHHRPGAGEARVVAPLEMTKWFDTNYHYLVPELGPTTAFALVLDQAGRRVHRSPGPRHRHPARPPRTRHLSPVWPSRPSPASPPWSSSRRSSTSTPRVLDALAAAGARWVQLDEPSWAPISTTRPATAIDFAYAELTRRTLKLLVATYFCGLGDNLALATALPVAGLHVDLVRDPDASSPPCSTPRRRHRPLGRGGRRPQRLAHRSPPHPRLPGPGPGAPGRPPLGGPLLLPPARPPRPAPRDRPAGRPGPLAGLRPPEAGGDRASDPGPRPRDRTPWPRPWPPATAAAESRRLSEAVSRPVGPPPPGRPQPGRRRPRHRPIGPAGPSSPRPSPCPCCRPPPSAPSPRRPRSGPPASAMPPASSPTRTTGSSAGRRSPP